MSLRDQSFVDRIARAERDLLDFKGAQIFGKDVTTPKVIQRYNSDGSPTEWDVIGEYSALTNVYKIGGTIEFTARNQVNPWATVYAVIRINPGNEIVTPYSQGFNAYADLDALFESNSKKIRFEVYGSAGPNFGPPSDPTIDRYWVKLYIFSTDYGDMKLIFPDGAENSKAGTVVPLT